MDSHDQPVAVQLHFDIDRSGPIPLYFQLAAKIELAIADGQLPPGSRIENEVALGIRLNLSRPTIRRAIQELVDKGMLVRRRGIGTQVVQGQVTRGLELTSLFDDLSRTSRHPTTTLLLHRLIAADARAAEQLSVAAGSPVLQVRRLRSADSTPIAILENFLPEEFADITAESLETHGLYELLSQRGVAIRVAKQRIGARLSNSEESKLLQIEKHGALLTMDRTAYDSSGRAIEFGHHCYRPDLYSFEATLVDK